MTSFDLNTEMDSGLINQGTVKDGGIFLPGVLMFS